MSVSTFKRVLLVGKDLDEVRPKILSHGFEIVEERPDLVISHGGDGTLIGAERQWPGVPKLAIQRSAICKKCEKHQDDLVLNAVAKGDITSTEFMKIEGCAKGECLIGINEIVVHNRIVTSAVRFIVKINDQPLAHETVGDGLVIATPFGSSGYFRSITNSTIQTGLGMAFNNTTEPIDHIVLEPEAEIAVRITRGPALVASDNNPQQIDLERNDEVLIRRHSHPATIINVDTMSCSSCRRMRETAQGDNIKLIKGRPDQRGSLMRP